MESDSLRTIPSLDFEPFDGEPRHSYDSVLRFLRTVNDRNQRLGSGPVRTEAEMAERAGVLTRPVGPDEPRRRWKPHDDDGLAWIRRRYDGSLVGHRSGSVELANQPGWDYDFRVAFLVMEVEGGPTFQCVAATPVARNPGGPVTASKAYRGIGEIIRRAGAALTWQLDDDADEGFQRGASPGDLEHLVRQAMATEPTARSGRRSTQQVDREAADVAERYDEWLVLGVGGSYARWISGRLGWGGEGQRGEDRVRARLRRAQILGLDVPKALSTRRRS